MKNLIIKSCFLLLVFCLNDNLYSQGSIPRIFINEFMASNASTVRSPDFQEYADWLEIYNAEDTTVDVSGFFLTDDLEKPQKWQIPSNARINPHGYLLVWADGRNEGRHANFNLSKSGEQIGLFSRDGRLIDSVRYAAQTAGISFGRYPDGSEDWFFFDKPTPAASNKNLGYVGFVRDPEFFPPEGFYQSAQSVELRTENPEESIRYTLDGSLPNQASPIYSAPLLVTATTVIRAQSLRHGYLPGNVITNTYFRDETTTLPVVSVATDPANLWDDMIGIYVEGANGIAGYCTDQLRNWNQPWERPISLEMYEADRSFGFKLDAGMQIGGGCTRLYPQKSLAIYARSEYGASKINYQIFVDKPIKSFNNMLLRNSGQDWWRAMFRDGMMHTLVKGMMDIDWLAYKPAILYLNGEYWGIHAIREKHNEHYLASNYGIDPDAIDILSGNASVVQGSARRYNDMIDFMKTHDMKAMENYNWVRTQMNVNEYLDYTIAEIYCANIDWPGGNVKYWRQQGENHKWRWILFDTDLGFGAHNLGQYHSNTLANATATSASYYANPPWSTLLLRKLLENADFKNQFIQRFASHLNITFNPTRVLKIIDSLKANIEAEIPRHIKKWEKSTSFNSGWNYHVEVMREFATKRPGYVIGQLIEKFKLSGLAQLSVNANDPSMGHVFINGVKLPGESFIGTYLKDIPLQCHAAPEYGYRFVGWQGISTSTKDSIAVMLTRDSHITAIFERDQSHLFSGLRINEILALNNQTNSDGSGDFDDWIELFNDSPQPMDIGGLYITDDLSQPHKWQIPASFSDATTMRPGQFLLLWADKEPMQGILHIDLKLSGAGDQIGLSKKTDSGFIFIDTLAFDSQMTDVSFGRFPDGSENWQFLTSPTPGASNMHTRITNEHMVSETDAWLVQNYPNPFNPQTTIHFGIPKSSEISIIIFNVKGEMIEYLFKGKKDAGKHFITWDAKDIPSGIYFIRLQADNFYQLRKCLLLK